MAEVRMDYGVVGNVASGFMTAADTMKKVSTVLEAAIQILRVTAFLSLGSTVWMERYLSNIKPRLDRLAATCEEMGNDLRAAIADHQQADQSAAPTFQ